MSFKLIQCQRYIPGERLKKFWIVKKQNRCCIQIGSSANSGYSPINCCLNVGGSLQHPDNNKSKSCDRLSQTSHKTSHPRLEVAV